MTPKLPLEILKIISTYLDDKTFFNLMITCKNVWKFFTPEREINVPENSLLYTWDHEKIVPYNMLSDDPVERVKQIFLLSTKPSKYGFRVISQKGRYVRCRPCGIKLRYNSNSHHNRTDVPKGKLRWYLTGHPDIEKYSSIIFRISYNNKVYRRDMVYNIGQKDDIITCRIADHKMLYDCNTLIQSEKS